MSGVLFLMASTLLGAAASTVLPERILGAGFEDGDPLRDCIVTAISSPAFDALFVAPPGDHFCVPQRSILGADTCYQNNGDCMPGCLVSVANTSVASDWVANRVHVIDALGPIAVRIDPPIFSACTLTVTISIATIDLDYAMLPAGMDGVFVGPLTGPSSFSFTSVNYSGCTVISFLANLVTDLLDDILGRYVQHTVARAPASAEVCPLP